MPCYSPMRAWRTQSINPETGNRGITFKRDNAYLDMELTLPCGKCMGCRIDKSIQWALRCVHESQSYSHNCFITLTYDEQNVPEDGSLNKKHFQDFMKRLRRSIEPIKIKFYMCGEYGDKLGRPHYHALIFGYDFPDKEEFKFRKDSILYTSKKLSELWPFGYATIGSLTYESAGYCARYAMKKIYGEKAEDHYKGKEPEYSSMSNGIGADFFSKYRDEILLNDSIVLNGREYKVPRFYDDKFTEKERNFLKFRRQLEFETRKEDNTLERLRVKEKVKQSMLRMLVR